MTKKPQNSAVQEIQIFCVSTGRLLPNPKSKIRMTSGNFAILTNCVCICAYDDVCDFLLRWKMVRHKTGDGFYYGGGGEI
jgi:hypothetical protein